MDFYLLTPVFTQMFTDTSNQAVMFSEQLIKSFFCLDSIVLLVSCEAWVIERLCFSGVAVHQRCSEQTVTFTKHGSTDTLEVMPAKQNMSHNLMEINSTRNSTILFLTVAVKKSNMYELKKFAPNKRSFSMNYLKKGICFEIATQNKSNQHG